MKNIFLRSLVWLLLATVALAARAQEEDLADDFKKLDATEQQRLRAVLAEPMPPVDKTGKLKKYFHDKEVAARLLADDAQYEANLRDAARWLPDASSISGLADLLQGKGQFDQANALRLQALAMADAFMAPMLAAHQSCDFLNQFKSQAARAAFADVAQRVKLAQQQSPSAAQANLLVRALSRSDWCRTQLELRLGRTGAALMAVDSAEQHAREAAQFMPINNPARRLNTLRDVAKVLGLKLHVQIAAGQLQQAELTLAQWLRFSQEAQLPPGNVSRVYASAADLRFSQREFFQSEQLIRKADLALQTQGRESEHNSRVALGRGLLLALAGQKKWPQAQLELERLEKLMADKASKKDQLSYPFERAVVNFGNQRYAQAAALFERVVAGNRQRYGEQHFFTAQAVGLQGAALWHLGTPESRTQALALLKVAVRYYMSAANADFMENTGYRKERREDVFAAYLEAMASTPGEDAAQTMGIADWVHGSLVQESLTEAAVRAAASTPALADVVRREQDARHEIAGLRKYLAGEAGAASSPLPQIAAQMRARIAELEAERLTLQAKIKDQFPDYARLVRPTPPTVADVARQLDPSQALLMLLPTVDAVYVWAVAADRPAAFVRVNLTEAQVGERVTRLRRQLDFAAGLQVGNQFDSAIAYELYDKLLAPVLPVWQGKTQLIVATGGRLSQLPLGVLQTQAGGGFQANAPWLIKQVSIAQVPSLSAWMALKSITRGALASQAFIGWGDPAFKLKSSVAPASSASEAIKNVSNSQPGNGTRRINLTRGSTTIDLDAPTLASTAPAALQYSNIPALPETRDELLAMAASLQANRDTDVLLGSRATRESVLAASQSGLLANKRVLAFATHGLMAGDLPNLNQPALAMAALAPSQQASAGVDANDPNNLLAPLLTLADVLTLKLNADWVVLSACNTAAADGKGEEALSGLARGFFYAGSRSLLVTHWAVESESAKQLTTATLAHYAANPQAPKAESLRQAMLKVMAQPNYAHPAYWAPYALVGDGGR